MTRIIAYYLPQFHPIPENDRTWGEGFTEWDNVRTAKPLFKGHLQPRIPTDLGYYDLRDNNIQIRQAELAQEAGIEGFCYWHYWFNGKRLLETPFNQMLQLGKPDFPFCLCWVNQSWTTRSWKKTNYLHNEQCIAKQTYPGIEDYRNHFETLLPAFKDHRYIRVDGKPLFGIYDPYSFAGVPEFIRLWQQWAKEEGLQGFHFFAQTNNTSTIQRDYAGNITRCIPDLQHSGKVYDSLLNLGFDAIQSLGMARGEMRAYGKISTILRKFINTALPAVATNHYDYTRVTDNMFAPEDSQEDVYPAIVPQWDKSPRVGKQAIIYTGATPEAFRRHLQQAIEIIKDKQPQHRILFLKSWNEWAEGNYIEPDLQYGHGFLEAIKEEVNYLKN